MWEYEEEIINQLNTIQCTNSLQLQNYPHNKELTHTNTKEMIIKTQRFMWFGQNRPTSMDCSNSFHNFTVNNTKPKIQEQFPKVKPQITSPKSQTHLPYYYYYYYYYYFILFFIFFMLCHPR